MRIHIRASVLLGLVCVSAFGEVSQKTGFLEHLMQTRWSGTIPFPPEKWVEDLLALSSADNKVYAVIFSKGRSPERKVTNDDRPRSLFAFGTNLYVGYSPQNNELQIISSNPGPPAHYDFEIVSNYGTKDQVIQAADKAQCMSCHHDGGPIFPVFPWSETEDRIVSTQRGGQTPITKFRMNSNLDPFASYLVKKSIDANPNFILDAARYEGNVLQGDTNYDSMRFCAKVCRGGLECEKMLLDIGLTSTEKYEDLFRRNLASRWEGYSKKTSLGDFQEASAGFSNSLPDRAPEAPIIGEVDPTTIRPKHLYDDPALSLSSSPVDVTDPKVMGKLIATIARRCFPFSDSQRKELDQNEVRNAQILALPELGDFLKNNWPPPVDDLMTFIRSRGADDQQCVVTAGEPISSTDPSNLEVNRDTLAKIVASNTLKPRSPGELFTHYCSACHVGAKVDYPLLLDDPESLAGYVGPDTGRRVGMMIGLPNPRMPPTGSPQPDPEERAEMIKSLIPSPSPKR